MNIYTEKGIALSFEEDKVLARVYPNTDILVEIKREAALHLYRLVNKYNYTIRTTKWGSFWRNITQIERSMTVFFIKTNTFDDFGNQFYFENEQDLPKDFSEINPKSRLPKITDSIEQELNSLYDIYMKSVVSKEEVKEYWEKEYKEVCELMKKYNQFENLLEVWSNDEEIEKIMNNVFQKEGHKSFENTPWGKPQDENEFQFLVRNAISLFASSGFQLASWKSDE